MRNWDSLVCKYCEEYQTLGRSKGSLNKVRSELDRFGNWLKSKRPWPAVEDIGLELIQKYLSSRGTCKAKSTLSGVISVIRCFGVFLEREEIWQVNHLRWIKGPKIYPNSKQPKIVSKKTLERLLETAAQYRSGYRQSFWIAILTLLYGTGIRRGELVSLNVSSWKREEGAVIVNGQKTGRERRVAVPELPWRCMERYLFERHNLLASVGNIGEQALIINSAGRRVRPDVLSSGLARLTRNAEVNRVTFHMLRHTCATNLIEDGRSLPAVQKYLGHEYVGSTMRYLHIADPKLAKAANLHPLNDIIKEEHHE